MGKLENLTNMAELQRMLEAQESGQARAINIEEMKDHLTSRVKGQDEVIDEVCRFVKIQWAKQKRKRPIANFLFLGPPGTGKTELAKAMAEYLYKDEKAIVRFDCSELGLEGKTHLIGTPVGYVGSAQGGKLTRPVINNPKRVVLFDEIEKADKSVLDLFLQMMGEGRLTEAGSGETADFTQAIIIMTSNAEYKAIGKLQEEMSDRDELMRAVKGHLAQTGSFRPEIADRIDKICIYKPLTGMIVAEIVIMKVAGIAKSYGLELAYIDPRVVFNAMNRGNKGGETKLRELERTLDETLGDHFIAAKEAGGKKVRLDIEEDGVMAISPAD